MDDVVDLSISSSGRDSVSLSNATVRDLRALTQNAGLTITPAPPTTVSNGKIPIVVYPILLLYLMFPTICVNMFFVFRFFFSSFLRLFVEMLCRTIY